jgi:hypothetical protein
VRNILNVRLIVTIFLEQRDQGIVIVALLDFPF